MNPRVVLLDDDPDNLTALEQMLHAIEETGVADVHRFTSAVEALAWCQTESDRVFSRKRIWPGAASISRVMSPMRASCSGERLESNSTS